MNDKMVLRKKLLIHIVDKCTYVDKCGRPLENKVFGVNFDDKVRQMPGPEVATMVPI